MPAPKTKHKYDVHPGVAMMQSIIAGMKEKTGRSAEEWIAYVNEKGPASEKERRDWLKAKHGLGTNYAWWIAERSVGKGGGADPEEYLRNAEQNVEKMFAGAKAGLRPIYDELLRIARGLGKDVRVCPCETIVPIYRNHVVAQVKPGTKTRIDFGLSLKDTKTPKRLIDTGGFAKKDRITRRIEITSIDDIDDEMKRWLKVAYDMDA